MPRKPADGKKLPKAWNLAYFLRLDRTYPIRDIPDFVCKAEEALANGDIKRARRLRTRIYRELDKYLMDRAEAFGVLDEFLMPFDLEDVKNDGKN